MSIQSAVDEHQRDIDAERAALDLFRQFVTENQDELRLVAHWGDGRCGTLSILLQDLLLPEFVPVESPKRKAYISRSLAKRVFERDAYRCQHCGDHHDLSCDHVIAESAGGPTTFENLQTLCRACNSRKGTT